MSNVDAYDKVSVTTQTGAIIRQHNPENGYEFAAVVGRKEVAIKASDGHYSVWVGLSPREAAELRDFLNEHVIDQYETKVVLK